MIKLGPGKRFEFNYDYCKGCGLCVAGVSVRRDQHGAGEPLSDSPFKRAEANKGRVSQGDSRPFSV